ncbi:VOC family protein [Neorhodopirellula pilleata]|uniref:3-demethylubiquinone-9 3-methyltransferase n=1 Tax=Neorhodopirellula pilleata TaxID=2714738 RepID=A0A5C6A6S0_9BACT|nr:VOC family protein [Neorhodopirellula pilleata]TWT95584.1 3-demethylubiquinone-9 3-methyltransferase [Neorhodopirellula pilleata]
MQIKQRITPFFSYADQAEQAAEFYVSVIPDSKIIRKVRNPGNQAVLTVEFELAGMKFTSLNAGQDWQFTEAFSLAIQRDTQDELDTLWDNLIADGGSELACGWLKDKFGMCWQVWPTKLQDWFEADDPVALQRMFEALWQMKKLDIAALQCAYDGRD